jgi:hypothetical protein
LRATAAPADLVAEQGELAVEEPLQQRRALALRQRRLVARHRPLEQRPVGHGRTHVGEHRGEFFDQPAPVARIGAFQLDIDHRFGRAGTADVGHRAVGVARHAHDGVDDAIDVEIQLADRGSDRIDQEGHVVVDDRESHPSPHVVRRDRFERDGGLARFALGGGLRDERGGGGAFGIAEARQLSRKRALGQPGGERLGHALVLVGHASPMLLQSKDLKACRSAKITRASNFMCGSFIEHQRGGWGV